MTALLFPRSAKLGGFALYVTQASCYRSEPLVNHQWVIMLNANVLLMMWSNI